MASLVVPGALFVGSLALLLAGSRVFTAAVERIGLALGVSPFVVGATVVAGGTSLPELTSSVAAGLAGQPGIVLGNVVGSNVANVLLVFGVAALAAGPISVDRELMRVDLPLLMASAVFLLVAVWTGPFTLVEGVLGLVGAAVYVLFTLSERDRLDEVAEELVSEYAGGDDPPPRRELEAAAARTEAGTRTYLLALGSLLVVLVAADRLVAAIVTIAGASGVGSDVVAITAVGVGTSLPEIAVSVTAARRGDAEIAVGNVLGSNVLNTFGVLGVASLTGPLSVPATIRGFALPVMVLATLLYYFVTQDRGITRWEGAALLLLYGVFLLNLAATG